MIKEILKPDNNIQCSINIDLDYKDDNKKQSYILTSKSIEIINEVITTFDNKNKNKSKILIGPYGKGKSHLALYIMGLISDDNRDEQKYNLLLKKSREQGEYVYNNIKEFIDSDKRYLPVVLNSTPYNKNLSDILIYSLKNALDINEIKDIDLDFYFEKAVNKIDLWENEYETAFNQFKSKLTQDVGAFKAKLIEYDRSSYEQFKSIYKEIMAGEEFNPYFEISPIKIYKEASEKLKGKGYKGIFVLYDEFSKYIEHLIAKNSILDIKLLQDFAEFCNRSEEQEVHMLLISHKAIAQYTNNANKSNIDAWKAIEGRFDEIQYNAFSNQQYEIISSAIKKDNILWENFKKEHSSRFRELKNNNFLRSLFKELSEKEFEDWIIYGAYPMYPLATYALPRISERVAQNERTLFSFLCKNENNSLTDYIITNSTEVRLDAIYDYFEDNIVGLGYSDEINKILTISNKVIEKLDTKLEKDIIKSISIIHMINNFTVIKPNESIIENLYGEEGIKVLRKLIGNNHIIHRSLNNILDISTDKDIEVITEIKNTKENNLNIDIVEFFNSNFKNVFIEARRYNDENNIIRYFKVKLGYDDISSVYIKEDLKSENVDGIVYLVEDIKEKHINEDLDVLFIKDTITSKIKEDIEYLNAIKKLKLNKNTDKSIKGELDILEVQYENIIKRYIESVLNLEESKDVFYNNKKLDINSKKELSNLISSIMDRVYYKTPIINNEMINKRHPSRVVLGARKKIIEQILDSKKDIEFRKGSLESTLLRSVLLLNNAVITSENENEYKLNYDIFEDDNKSNFSILLKEVDKIIQKSTKEEVNLEKIYKVLEDKKYGYGMKKGPIPIVLAFIFNKHKKYLSILEDGREIQLSANTIESIDMKPEKYTIKLQEVNDEREVYIKNLENIFVDYINIKEKNEDDLTYLTLGIKKWFLYLSKYVKNTKKIYQGNKEFVRLPKHIVKFKNKLRILNENSIRFLFEDMVDIFEVGSYEKLIEKVRDSKDNIDKYESELYKDVSDDFRNIFSINKEASLNRGLYQWLSTIDKTVVFKSGLIGGFIKLIEDNIELNNQNEYLDKISNYILGLYIVDWNDDTPNLFIDKLTHLREEIGNLSQYNHDDTSNNMIMELGVTKTVDLGTKANMLLDDLRDTLEDYGSSVSEEEKRVILIEILKDIK